MITSPQIPFPADLERLAATPMFGRTAERQLVADLLARRGNEQNGATRLPPCQLIAISGEAGVGKTRFAADIAAEAFAAGHPAIYGRCTERLDLAYQPFVQALRPVDPLLIDAAQSTMLVDTTPGDDAALRQHQLFGSFADALVDLAASGGAVLVLDDLHWASTATIALLEHLVSVRRPPGLLIAITLRDDAHFDPELRQLLLDIERRGDGLAVPLRGLDEAALHELLLASNLRVDADVLAVLLRSTDGNPLFVGELASAAIAAGRDIVEPGGTLPGDLPAAITNLIEERINRIGGDAEVLEVAATMGVDFELSVLDRATPSYIDPLPTLEAASRSMLIAELGPDKWQFRQALTRKTLTASIGPARSARYHAAIADGLATVYGAGNVAHLGRRAHHLCAAARPGSTQTAVDAALAAAASRLDQLDAGQALQHLSAGLEALALDPADRAAIEANFHLLAAEAHLQLFDHPARLAAATAAEACARACGDSRLLAKAALARSAFWTQGSFDAGAVPTLLEAFESLGDDDRSEAKLRSELLTNLSGSAGVAGNSMPGDLRASLPGDAAEMARTAVALAREAGDALGEVTALGALIVARWDGPNAAEQLDLADQIAAVDHPTAQVTSWRWTPAPALILGDRVRFENDVARLAADARTLGSRHLEAYALQCQALTALLEARFGDAAQLGAVAVETARHHPNFSRVYQAQLFWAAYEQGQLAQLLPFVHAAMESDPAAQSFRAMFAITLAHSGQREAAAEEISLLAANNFDDIVVDIVWTATMIGVADTIAQLGDPTHAARIGELLAPYGGQLAVIAGGAFVYGAVDRLRAVLAALDGDTATAEHLFAAALDQEAAVNAPALSLRTRYWRLRLLGDSHDQAAPLLRAAERLGLTGLAADLTALSALAIAGRKLAR